MPPVVHLHPDHETASQAVANRLAAFAAREPVVLALPSGQTPVRVYELLREHAHAFSRATTFALDEYVGLGADDPRSFAAFFRETLFGPLGWGPDRARCLDGRASDLDAEAARYERAIADSGGLDLTLLGLGANGHIAFNEPGASLSARTHVTPLQPPASSVAARGITMGVGTLFSAPRVWLLATGASKARAVQAMLEGPVDPHWPASLLQVHPQVEVFLDAAAASLLARIAEPGG